MQLMRNAAFDRVRRLSETYAHLTLKELASKGSNSKGSVFRWSESAAGNLQAAANEAPALD